MILFDDKNFKEIDYLKFEANFKVEVEDKIKILFAPNGTCKTSLYKNIKERNPQFDYIDYEDIKNSFIKGIKNDIQIGANIVEINRLVNEKTQLKDSVDFNSNFKFFNITKIDQAKLISEKLGKLKNNSEECIKTYSDDKLNELFDLNDDQKKYIAVYANKIIETKNDKLLLNDLKESYKLQALNLLDEYLDSEECKCPICDTVKNIPIKKIVKEKIEEIKIKEENLLNLYKNKYPNKTINEVEEEVKSIIEVFIKDEIVITNIENFIIAGGNRDKSKLILENSKRIKEIEIKLKELEDLKEKFYTNLKAHKVETMGVFMLQFKVANKDIVFDDSNKLLNIKLPRKVDTYSTGEINLLVFITKILEFYGSDSECLLCDDPISSYDLPNQYRIIYEITQGKNENKKILIFTHNIDVINIANTQYCGAYDYECVEKCNDFLYLNKIYCGGETSTFITKEKLQDSIDSDYDNKVYLDLICDREIEDNKNNGDMHEIVHYNMESNWEYEGVAVSNKHFIDIIDNLNKETIKNETYWKNVANKILYLIAIRVWIEKQLYDNCKYPSKIAGKQLGEKIITMYDSNLWKDKEIVSRPFLMSKKVMLNQNAHLDSQKMPFYYILNLTLDDIVKEIIDIRENFIKGDQL